MEQRPAGSGFSAGSATQVQRSWASSGEATSGARTGELDAAVNALRLQFADSRSRLQSFAQAEQDRVRQLEQTVATVYDLRVDAHNRLLGRYREAKSQLAAKEEELRRVQAAAAEVPDLRSRLDRAGRLRDQAVTERDRLQAKADRLAAERDQTAAAHRAELGRLAEEHRKAAAQKDEQLARAAEEITQLKADRDRSAGVWAAKERQLLGEAQYIDELLTRVFPETQVSAEAAVDAHRREQRAEGAATEEYAAWTMAEITIAAKARLEAVERDMHRLIEASLAMLGALWPNAVVPRTVSRAARWLEAGVARLDAWRASAARAGAEMALSFVLSWYPSVDLDRLAARRAGAEGDLVQRATPIAVRASDIASFTPYDDFVPERAPDGEALPADDFGLAVEDPEGSEAETEAGAGGDAAGLDDTGASEEPAQPDA